LRGRTTNGIEHNYKQSLAKEYRLTKGAWQALRQMVKTESGKRGLDFNFLATNSKPQIAKTNRESDKRGECMFSKPKSEPSCKVVQKTTAAVTTTTQFCCI